MFSLLARPLDSGSGDERCVFTLGQQMDLDSAEVQPKPAGEKKSREDRQNATIIAIFEWLRSKGRLVHIAKEKLRRGFISFAEAEAKTSDTGGGWDSQPDPTTDNTLTSESNAVGSGWENSWDCQPDPTTDNTLTSESNAVDAFESNAVDASPVEEATADPPSSHDAKTLAEGGEASRKRNGGTVLARRFETDVEASLEASVAIRVKGCVSTEIRTRDVWRKTQSRRRRIVCGGVEWGDGAGIAESRGGEGERERRCVLGDGLDAGRGGGGTCWVLAEVAGVGGGSCRVG